MVARELRERLPAVAFCGLTTRLRSLSELRRAGKVGNLTSSVAGGVTTTYALGSGTNQLASYTVGSGSPVSVSTNGNGNITSIPPAVGGTAATFTYNVANRLSGVSGGGSTSASYLYGAFGERVSKTVSSATTVYAYGLDELGGQLLEENNGSTVTDYIYVEGWLVGMYVGQPAGGTGGTVYDVQPDVTGYPALVTDGSGSTVWSANHEPYGTTGTITSSVTQNIRFPGQFFDAETGFHQNNFRDYMPNLGRYLEADPIGLGGGTNPFAYAKANPARYFDPTGRMTVVVINNNDTGTGTHAGLFVSHGDDGQPAIYDPSGSYDEHVGASGPNGFIPPPRDGESGIITGPDADWMKYFQYQLSDGADVQFYVFPTTPEEEQAILARAHQFGDPRGFNCANKVSSALQGIGPFKDLGHYYVPSLFGRGLANLQDKLY